MSTKIDLLTPEVLNGLRNLSQPPCLSLYQPTHRHHPGNQQDPIRFAGLVNELEKSTEQKYSASESAALLAPFRQLGEDRAFWNHTHDGLAVFGAPGFFRVFRLQRSVPAMADVADSFHIKPLWRLLQSTDRYHVLGLSLDRIRLFEGNRDVLDEVEPAPGVPRTIEEALGDELTEPHQTVASYGGAGAGSVAMRHGHGGRKDEADVDAERFFRAVDRAVAEHYSKPSGLPLILASLPEHQGLFRKISQNPALLPDGVKGDPQASSTDQLRERVWQIVEPQYRERIATVAGEFARARSAGLGLDDPDRIAEAATAGRVATLLLDAERQLPGRLDAASGSIERFDLDHPEAGDVLDDLGELVINMGGRVVVLPTGDMPTETGVAATCRYRE